MTKPKEKAKDKPKNKRIVSYPMVALATVFAVILLSFIVLPELFAGRYDRNTAEASTTTTSIIDSAPKQATLDTVDYDRRMQALANYGTSSASTTLRLWPVKGLPYPNAGAILPFRRVVAYYGNFYSTQMGVLGQYPPDVVVQKLEGEVSHWEAADPTTPVIPAVQYIAVTAQGSPQDGTYRLRMPTSQIDKALAMANQVHGLLILDVQVGLSTLPQELPHLAKYLAMPNVELAIDPEFSMHGSEKPGTVIGTMSSHEVNYAIQYLDGIVSANNLPPKILVVHRFTEAMVTGYQNIAPTANVQVVMDMDGWGSPAKKLGTYTRIVAPEPVQFTGFKLFYKNDLRPPSTRMLTPAELLKLRPIPIYIQYQ